MSDEEKPKTIFERAGEAYRHLVGIKELDPAGALSRQSDRGFTRLTGRSQKEIPPLEWRRQMEIAYFLWLQNPIAFRLNELQTDFVVGDGFSIEAKDEKIQQILDAHWNDPDNNWDKRQHDLTSELGLFGTVAMKPFTNKINGFVKLSALDPGWITELIPHPDKLDQVFALRMTRPTKDTVTWKVIRPDEEINSESRGKLMGEVFYFAINRLSFLLQGKSDLFPHADWLDALDQFLFHTMERIIFLNSFIYDVTIQGANDKVVKARAADLENRTIRAGSVRVHNEKEKWEALAPKINSAEIEQITRLIKMLVFGSAGVPEHWFGDGGNTNRATAVEMAGPVLRKYRRRQFVIKTEMEFIFQYVIDQAVLANPERFKNVDQTFQVIAPDLSAKDVGLFIDTLGRFTDTLIVSIDAGFVTKDTASKMWAEQASSVGMDVKTPEAERAEADAQRTDGPQPAAAPAPAAPPEDPAAAVEAQPYTDLAQLEKDTAVGKALLDRAKEAVLNGRKAVGSNRR